MDNKLYDGLKVFVYFNLHKKMWSIRALEGEYKGLVVAHLDTLSLRECTPKVSEAGRQRVLRSKCKNVHAGIVGRYVSNGVVTDQVKIYYNPYKTDKFIYSNGECYSGSQFCSFDSSIKSVYSNE